MKTTTPPQDIWVYSCSCSGAQELRHAKMCVWRELRGGGEGWRMVQESRPKPNSDFSFLATGFYWCSYSFTSFPLILTTPLQIWELLKLKKEIRKLFIHYWNISNTLWTALGQQHTPWPPVLKHLVALKIFTWHSRKSSWYLMEWVLD